MSSDKSGENPLRRKSKVSYAMLVIVGLGSDKSGENPLRRKSKVSYAMLVIVGLVGS